MMGTSGDEVNRNVLEQPSVGDVTPDEWDACLSD